MPPSLPKNAIRLPSRMERRSREDSLAVAAVVDVNSGIPTAYRASFIAGSVQSGLADIDGQLALGSVGRALLPVHKEID